MTFVFSHRGLRLAQLTRMTGISSLGRLVRRHWVALGVLAISGCVTHENGNPCGTLTECGGSCVPIEFDALNCGGCGIACLGQLACMNGVCVVPNANVGTISSSGGSGGSSAGSSGQSGAAGGSEAGAAGKGAAGGQGAGMGGGVGKGGAAGQVGASGAAGKAGASGAAGKSAAGGATGGVGAGGTTTGPGTGGSTGTSGAGGLAGKSGSPGGAGAPSAGGGVGASGGSSGSSSVAGAAGNGGSPGGAGSSGSSGSGGGGGAGGSVAIECIDPLSECSGTCVDLSSDDNHCGSCTTHCSTGICQSGECFGSALGHQILFGMDLAKVPGNEVEERKLLGNAVFLGASNTSGHWRAVGFDPFGSPSVTAVDSMLATQAIAHGATDYKLAHATDTATLLSALSIKKSNVVVIYDQPKAKGGDMLELGGVLAAPLDAFSRAGGVVVVLSGGQGSNQMWAFAQQAGLFPAIGFSVLPSTAVLEGAAPLDGISVGIAMPFAAPLFTGAWLFETSGGDWDIVLRDQATKAPVVLHRAVLPPNVP